MKCPKCGSGLFLSHYYNSCMNKECENYHIKFTKKELKEIKHQQRLDKVLAKFEEDDMEEDEVVFALRGSNEISYKNNVFYLGEYYDHLYERLVISLDTVEHLIKDMESDKV